MRAAIARRQPLPRTAIAAMLTVMTTFGLASPSEAIVVPGAPVAGQDAPAARPTQTVSSVLLTGEWWAPDFAETWSFRPDARGGVAARQSRRQGMNSISLAFDFDPASDGRRLTGRFQTPPDVLTYDEVNGVVLQRAWRSNGQPAQHIRLQRLRGPEGSAAWTAPFVGRWSTNGGVVTFTESNGFLHGRLERLDANGAPSLVRRFVFVQIDGDQTIGAWAGPDGFQGAEATINLGPDGESLHGRMLKQVGSEETWSARRLEASPETSPRPAPTPLPTPAPSVPEGAPTAPQGDFRGLGAFEVRFDALERPRGTGVVRAVVTIRNAGQQLEHLPSGTFRAILTDSDGVGQERNQLWRGSGEPAQLFNGTPTLQPGGELTVRFTFNPDNRDLDNLVLMRGQERVEFDVSGQ